MYAHTSIFDIIWRRKVPFLVTFFIVFTLSYGFLTLIDFLPEPVQVTEPETMVSTETPKIEESLPEVVTALPTTLTIPSLERVATVANPTTSDITTLDGELLKGLVRHPDSAKLGEKGNILILGHSSYLPNVMNKNYQALNGIQKLVWGDLITLSSDTTVYTYRVDKVYQSKASDVVIKTDNSGQKLTLVTCNSFGSKEDRFIVEANLVSEKPL